MKSCGREPRAVAFPEELGQSVSSRSAAADELAPNGGCDRSRRQPRATWAGEKRAGVPRTTP